MEWPEAIVLSVLIFCLVGMPIIAWTIVALGEQRKPPTSDDDDRGT